MVLPDIIIIRYVCSVLNEKEISLPFPSVWSMNLNPLRRIAPPVGLIYTFRKNKAPLSYALVSHQAEAVIAALCAAVNSSQLGELFSGSKIGFYSC